MRRVCLGAGLLWYLNANGGTRSILRQVCTLPIVPERQLKNGAKFVIDDDHSDARRQVCERFASHRLQHATRRLLCCLLETGEFKAPLVEDGHLTTSA